MLHTVEKIIRKVANRRTWWNARFSEVADLWLKSYHNFNYNFYHNGEKQLLQRLSKFPIECVFDVGACEGTYAKHCWKLFTKAQVHCFEVVPAIYKKHIKSLGLIPRLEVNGFGLGEESGEIEVLFDPKYPDRSTILNIKGLSLIHNHRVKFKSVMSKIQRGDSYMNEKNISHIDLLKIDVEGAEPYVLDGFKDSFKNEKIRMVQFEYGWSNIYSKYLLSDFYRLFEGYGFVVGKLYPEGVDFRPYHPSLEDFRGPNYVAIHKSKKEWIDELSFPLNEK